MADQTPMKDRSLRDLILGQVVTVVFGTGLVILALYATPSRLSGGARVPPGSGPALAVSCAVVFGVIFLINLVYIARRWRIDSDVANREDGRCPRCQYSLKGLSARAACPECGCDIDSALEEFESDER